MPDQSSVTRRQQTCGLWVTKMGSQLHWRLQGKQSAPCPFLSSQGSAECQLLGVSRLQGSVWFLTSLCTHRISTERPERVLFLCAFSEQGNILSAVGSINLAPLQDNSTRVLLLLTPSTD